MSSPTTEIKVTAAYTRTLGTMPLSMDMLHALAVIDPEDATIPNECWAEIGLMSGGRTHANKVALLAAGWIGRNCPIGWTGSIPITEDMYAYAVLTSVTTHTYRLAAIMNKLIPLPGGGFRVDP